MKIHIKVCLSSLFVLVDEITNSFRRYGHLVVDWPHKAESKSYFPPKGNSVFPELIFPHDIKVYTNKHHLGHIAIVELCAESRYPESSAHAVKARRCLFFRVTPLLSSLTKSHTVPKKCLLECKHAPEECESLVILRSDQRSTTLSLLLTITPSGSGAAARHIQEDIKDSGNK